MVESFGFTQKGLVAGLLLCGLFVLPFFLVIAVVVHRKKMAGLLQIFVVCSLGCALGVLFAEAQLLADEVAFAEESVQSQDARHSRARQWPHENAGIVFAQERGFWATD